MSEIFVNIATLQQTCENNEAYTQKLTDQYNDLNKVAADLRSKWGGAASQTYFSYLEAKQETLKAIIEGMKRVTTFERGAVEVYKAVNKDVGVIIDGMY